MRQEKVPEHPKFRSNIKLNLLVHNISLVWRDVLKIKIKMGCEAYNEIFLPKLVEIYFVGKSIMLTVQFSNRKILKIRCNNFTPTLKWWNLMYQCILRDLKFLGEHYKNIELSKLKKVSTIVYFDVLVGCYFLLKCSSWELSRCRCACTYYVFVGKIGKSGRQPNSSY